MSTSTNPSDTFDVFDRVLNADELNRVLPSLAQGERTAVADVVAGLATAALCESYRQLGYSSLYAFCTGYLQYTAGQANARIAAARLAILLPEIIADIKSGALTLTGARLLSAPLRAHDDPTAILELARHKTCREIRALLSPDVRRPRQDRVLRFLSKEVLAKLEYAIEVSRDQPGADLDAFLSSALAKFIRRYQGAEKASRAPKRPKRRSRDKSVHARKGFVETALSFLRTRPAADRP